MINTELNQDLKQKVLPTMATKPFTASPKRSGFSNGADHEPSLKQVDGLAMISM